MDKKISTQEATVNLVGYDFYLKFTIEESEEGVGLTEVEVLKITQPIRLKRLEPPLAFQFPAR